MRTNTPKNLRFAALIRVSTDAQEQQGISLVTQRQQIEQAVAMLGGAVIDWYGGSEHATAGWEQREMDRMMSDALTDKYEAIIVADLSRWSRDNEKHLQRRKTLLLQKKRFFVLTDERDLFDINHRLTDDLQVRFAEFAAAQTRLKSLQGKINKAKLDNAPSAGKLPFGRIFDKATKTWRIDAEKQAIVIDVAQRYLSGEPLAQLVREFKRVKGLQGFGPTNLREMLRDRCGPTWTIRFKSEEFDIHETVELRVPPLLPDSVIQRIQAKAKANQMYPPGKHSEYQLSGHVRCSRCDYRFVGSVYRGRRYYRHSPFGACPGPKPWVRAEVLEDAVFRQLFSLFGNPAAVTVAVRAALPDQEKREQFEAQLEDLQGMEYRLERKKARVLESFEDGDITRDEKTVRMKDIKDEMAAVKVKIDGLREAMGILPTTEELIELGAHVAANFKKYTDAKLVALKQSANEDFAGLTKEDKSGWWNWSSLGKPRRGRTGEFIWYGNRTA